jgi:hypothetical protein
VQVRVGVELEECVVDVLDELVSGGVELLGPIQRDVADRPLLVVEHRLKLRRRIVAFGHRALLSRPGRFSDPAPSAARFYCRGDAEGNGGQHDRGEAEAGRETRALATCAWSSGR